MVVVAHESGQQARGARPRPSRDRVRTRRLMQNLPVVGLGVAVCMAVGYGFGTLVQFDRDWRSQPPILVASLDGPVTDGGPLADAVDAVLRAGQTSVRGLLCPEVSVPAAEGQMCHGRGEAGMLSIVATQSAELLHVEVFAAR